MLTRKVKKLISLLSILLVTIFVGTFFILQSLTNNILYFKSPSDIKISKENYSNKKIRIGGMVKKDSLKVSSEEIKFIVTDFKNEIIVSYKGTVPNLFLDRTWGSESLIAVGLLSTATAKSSSNSSKCIKY